MGISCGLCPLRILTAIPPTILPSMSKLLRLPPTSPCPKSTSDGPKTGAFAALTTIGTAWDAPTNRVPLASNPTCVRSEEHTSELQSLRHLVCRLLLEKKKIVNAYETS